MSKYMRVPFAGQDESSLTPEQREMKQFALDNNKAVAAEAARRSEAARKAAKTRAENQRLQNKWEREQAEAEWLRREDALRAAGDDACAEVHVDLNAILYQWRGSQERAAQEAKNAAEGALEALVAKHGIDVVLG